MDSIIGEKVLNNYSDENEGVFSNLSLLFS